MEDGGLEMMAWRWWLGDDGFVDGGLEMMALEMVGCECCIGNGRWNLKNGTFFWYVCLAIDLR